MIKVYCDSGAYRKELTELEKSGAIQLFQFKYENKNKNITHIAQPSMPTYSEMNYTFEDLNKLTLGDLGYHSIYWKEILAIVGGNNERDAKHLDAAYMEGCSIFITNDKDDISSRKHDIYDLLRISVFHYLEDWRDFLACVSGSETVSKGPGSH